MQSMIQIIIQTIGIGIAIAGFSVLLDTPKKYVGLAALTGAVGGGSYLVCMACGVNESISYFVSALMVTVVSKIFAKKYHVPITTFLIAGILPNVPGAGVYQVAYNAIMGNQEQTLYYLFNTIEFASVIALGIFVTDSFFRLIKYNKKEKLKKLG